MGPRATARAARWADGISGFSIAGEAGEMLRAAELADRCWAEAGREAPPRKVTGCFVALGVPDAGRLLHAFAERYLGFLGPELATALAATAQVTDADAVRRVLDAAASAGYDELVLVPATAASACHEALAEAAAGWLRT